MLFLHIKYITSKNTIKTVQVMKYTFKKYKWLINITKYSILLAIENANRYCKILAHFSKRTTLKIQARICAKQI